jgi:hypothetical protein
MEPAWSQHGASLYSAASWINAAVVTVLLLLLLLPLLLLRAAQGRQVGIKWTR